MKALTQALERAAATRSKKEKAAAVADALVEAAGRGPLELATCARFVLGQPLPTSDSRTLGVGWSLSWEAIARAFDIPAADLGQKTRELGDLGDAVAELLAARGRQEGDLALAEVARLFDQVASLSGREEKMRLLCEAFARAGTLEAKYLVKVILGELRIGVAAGVLEDAIAKAFEVPPRELRRAAAVVVDVGELAVLAHAKDLGAARVRVGVPVAFMLAAPNETCASPIERELTVVEDKLDGVRAQVHVVRTPERSEGTHAAPTTRGGAHDQARTGVRIFARGQGEVTRAFPEIAEGLAVVKADAILDGEILAVDAGGKPRPFQALQQRLGRVAPEPALLRDVPVRFFAFDVLFAGEPLLDRPWSARRERLRALLAEAPTPAATLNEARSLAAEGTVDEAVHAEFEAARARGAEGLVLKRTDAAYEAGKRGGAWRKVKRELASLDVVVTAVERGHGRRAKVLSDYTFAVWSDGELLDIGKAYSGLTDAEIAAMTARFQQLSTEVRGGYHVVRPEVVIEVAFEGLQRSDRHASGFALRFPRIVRVRDDKKPAEADTLDTARSLYEAQLASGHREEISAPRAKRPKEPKKPKKESRQLSLFGEDD
jgi:DNA ligase-1